jgi:predicted metal-dependent hydrolase
VGYDPKLRVLAQALGTHTKVSRVQGGKLKAKREIRVASLFREAPADMLRMIVAHELAHQKEAEHDRAFYSLCEHLAPGYHQLEFATRVWLMHRDAALAAAPAADAAAGLTPGPEA